MERIKSIGFYILFAFMLIGFIGLVIYIFLILNNPEKYREGYSALALIGGIGIILLAALKISPKHK